MFFQEPDPRFLPSAATNSQVSPALSGPGSHPKQAGSIPREPTWSAACWKRGGPGHSPAPRAPGDDQQHLLVHPPRGAPGKMCPRGEGTFFSFSKRPQYAAIGPAYMQGTCYPPQFLGCTGRQHLCLHYFPVPSVSVSPNALLMLPFFSVRSDFCFSCISNVPGDAIRISPFRLTAQPGQNSEVFLPSCLSGPVSSLVLPSSSSSGIGQPGVLSGS